MICQISLIIATLLASKNVVAISESWKSYESFVNSMANNSHIQEAWADHLTQFQVTDPAHLEESPLGVFPRYWPEYCPDVPEPKEHGTNVHNLLPSDIKLVAGIGDSLTAANGAKASTAFGLLIQYRGRSFSMGGDGDGRGWETQDDVVTFPNLLRNFRPDLIGDSIYKGSHDSQYARFNHAIPGSTAHDLKSQAEALVAHLKASPEVDFEKDWKVITVFVGGNDLCDYHMRPGTYEPDNFTRSLQETLDVLHAHIPRAFVNLVETIDISVLHNLSQGFMCPLLHHFLCRYPSKVAYSNEIRFVRDGYLRGIESLVNSGRYDTRDDFAVVTQPFLRNSSYPRNDDGTPDFGFFAPDCFHFSSKGHATAGASLWNNMMQPIGMKQTSWALNQEPECIDPNNPFIKTKVNSAELEKENSAAAKSRSWFRTWMADGSSRQPVTGEHMSGLDLAGNEDEWSSQSFPLLLLGVGVCLGVVAIVAIAVVSLLKLKNKRIQTGSAKIQDGRQELQEVCTTSSTVDLTKCEVSMDVDVHGRD